MGPTLNKAECLGWAWTTPATSDVEDGRACDEDRGEPGMACDCWFWTEALIEVGGGSCGGETCGVIMAGSVRCFLCSSAPPVLSSRDDVPAGVRGGECMADPGDDGMEERWYEWPEVVREAGDGDGAFVSELATSHWACVCQSTYSRGRE
jgi:hypothetical protein